MAGNAEKGDKRDEKGGGEGSGGRPSAPGTTAAGAAGAVSPWRALLPVVLAFRVLLLLARGGSSW